jgi:hypothetical protein
MERRCLRRRAIPVQETAMPTIFRFAMVSAVVAGLCYGVIYALATFLEPPPREISVTVPPSRYAK